MAEPIELEFGPLNTSAEQFTGWLFEHACKEMNCRDLLSERPILEVGGQLMNIWPRRPTKYSLGSIGVEFGGRRWVEGTDPVHAHMTNLYFAYTAIPLDNQRILVRAVCYYLPLFWYFESLLTNIARLWPDSRLVFPLPGDPRGERPPTVIPSGSAQPLTSNLQPLTHPHIGAPLAEYSSDRRREIAKGWLKIRRAGGGTKRANYGNQYGIAGSTVGKYRGQYLRGELGPIDEEDRPSSTKQ